MPRAACGLMSKNREPASEMATAASPAAAAAWVRASQVKGGMISRREKSWGGPAERLGAPARSDDRNGSHEAGELTALSALRRSGGSLRSLDLRSPPLGRFASLTLAS